MSFVGVVAEALRASASQLAGLGAGLNAANAAAASQTTGMLAAAEDEVSTAIAALFSSHGESFQALRAQAAAFHDQFVQTLSAGSHSYVSAEAANLSAFSANPAQTIGQYLANAINAPSLAFTGRPLIGNGANAAPGTGQNGAAGGLFSGLFGAGGGNGGAGGLSGGGVGAPAGVAAGPDWSPVPVAVAGTADSAAARRAGLAALAATPA